MRRKSYGSELLPGLTQTANGPLVLLFYDGYELSIQPGRLGYWRSNARRMLRYVKRTLCRQQVRTGFYTAFLSLRDSLRLIGCDVRVNDFATARKYPTYPIGVAGYVPVIGKVDLPNPRIFGPGDFGDPEAAQAVAGNPRFIKLMQPSDWFADLYRPYCGDKMWTWFAGIDTDRWADASGQAKSYDFVIYDKIRWHREERVPRILDRVIAHLEQCNLTYLVLRYGQHHHTAFADALRRSRAMLFICEHETQGLAYQEALSANVPVLAWDEGEMVDPHLQPYMRPDTAISSVPYFSPECGMTFRLAEFEQKCDEFCRQRERFAPRIYVMNNLSLKQAGERYLAEYAQIAARQDG